ncbi:putative flavonol synthase [Parahypoxylon ruwenzoriense]
MLQPWVDTVLPSYEYPDETGEQLEYAELEALDISKLNEPGGKEALAEQVLRFINKNGFFYVIGHGFSDEEVRRQYALCQAFFELPLEEKLQYACDTAKGDFRGYKLQSTGKLAARDNNEQYNIPKFTAEHARPHPPLIRAHWDEIRAFSLKIHDGVLLPLLRLFAHVLEVDGEFLVERHHYEAEGLEYLRYMKYHPRAAEADAQIGNIWAKGHTDYNTLTFLFHQPVAGLQVQTPEGKWKYVRSPRDAIIVNIADALEFLSGSYLKSTVHRVVRPPNDQAGRPRLSLIYFARPEANILLKPVSSPLLRHLGLQDETEQFSHDVTAEEWARARIAKDHRFRTGLVDQPEKEIIAGVNQKYYD